MYVQLPNYTHQSYTSDDNISDVFLISYQGNYIGVRDGLYKVTNIVIDHLGPSISWSVIYMIYWSHIQRHCEVLMVLCSCKGQVDIIIKKQDDNNHHWTQHLLMNSSAAYMSIYLSIDVCSKLEYNISTNEERIIIIEIPHKSIIIQ